MCSDPESTCLQMTASELTPGVVQYYFNWEKLAMWTVLAMALYGLVRLIRDVMTCCSRCGMRKQALNTHKAEEPKVTGQKTTMSCPEQVFLPQSGERAHWFSDCQGLNSVNRQLLGEKTICKHCVNKLKLVIYAARVADEGRH